MPARQIGFRQGAPQHQRGPSKRYGLRSSATVRNVWRRCQLISRMPKSLASATAGRGRPFPASQPACVSIHRLPGMILGRGLFDALSSRDFGKYIFQKARFCIRGNSKARLRCTFSKLLCLIPHGYVPRKPESYFMAMKMYVRRRPVQSGKPKRAKSAPPRQPHAPTCLPAKRSPGSPMAPDDSSMQIVSDRRPKSNTASIVVAHHQPH